VASELWKRLEPVWSKQAMTHRWVEEVVGREGGRAFLCRATRLDGDAGELVGAALVLMQETPNGVPVERAQDLARLGQRLAEAVHDLRRPLTGVQGMAQLLVRQMQGTDDLREYAEMILSTVRDLSNTVERVLQFARSDQPVCVDIDLHRLAEDLWRSIHENPGTDTSAVRFALDVPEGARAVRADPEQLRRSLANLMTNAVEAMPEGGVLTVAARPGGPDDGDSVCISVSDTGTGIDEEELPLVTEPFHSSKPSGVGLGLAVVARMVSAHGGRLDIESTPGAGTTVSMVLPGGAFCVSVAASATEPGQSEGVGS
jgi:signal transduction histidine kinase